MIGEVVRYKRNQGDCGIAQRFLVTSVAFDQTDRRFVALAINVTKGTPATDANGGPYREAQYTPDHGDYGDVVQLVANHMRRETAKERDIVEPYVKPPPTLIPGPGVSR